MEESHRNAFRECLPFLQKNLKVHSFIDLVYSSPDKVLSDEDYEKILVQETDSNKIRHLVLILRKSGPKAFDVCIESLKSSHQTFIANELLKKNRNDLSTDSEYAVSQTPRKDLSGAEFSRKRSCYNADSTSDLTGYIHQVRKCQSSQGYWYSRFWFQTGEKTHQRCLTFLPNLHTCALERYAREQIPVCLKNCIYDVPTKKSKYPTDTIKIDSETEFENAKVIFAYNPPPFTSLAGVNASCLNKFLFIKVEIFKEDELTKKTKSGTELVMQVKYVRDEDGTEMKLTAWEQFANILTVGKWYELYDVSVKLVEGTYSLSTSTCTSAKLLNFE